MARKPNVFKDRIPENIKDNLFSGYP